MLRIITVALLLFLVATGSGEAGNTATNFGGVGIDGVASPDGQIIVRQLVAGGPAHLAGVRNGDVITHIDGKATRGSNFTQLVERRLRGKAGTKVTLTLQRPGAAAPLHVTLTRRQMVLPPPAGSGQR